MAALRRNRWTFEGGLLPSRKIRERVTVQNNITMKTKSKAQPAATEKILIVDDDPQILDLFSALLQKAGYRVDKAEHALAAVAAVVRAAPDLILADIRMPIVDGKEL